MVEDLGDGTVVIMLADGNRGLIPASAFVPPADTDLDDVNIEMFTES